MSLKHMWDRNGSNILTGVTVAGAIASGYLWYKAGPKVEEVRKQWKEREDNGEEVPTSDKVMDILPILALPTGVTLVTIGASVGSNRMSASNIAGLTIIAEKAKEHSEDISNAARKIVGNEKAEEIEEEARKQKRARIVEDVIVQQDDIFDTETGDVLFIDEESGIRFLASRSYVILCWERYQKKTMDGDYGYCGGAWSDFLEELGVKKVPALSRRNGLTPEEASRAYIRFIDDEYGVYTIIEAQCAPHNF